MNKTVLEEFNISTKSLTEEQIYELNKKFNYLSKMGLVYIIIFGFFIWWILVFKIINIVYPFDKFLSYKIDSLSLYINLFIFMFSFYLSQKIYMKIGHHFINLKIQEIKLNNLNNKVEKQL